MADGKPTIILCAEAKTLGLKRFFTGRKCKHGHLSERLVCNNRCIECHDNLIGVNRASHYANFKRWYEKNREKQKERMRSRPEDVRKRYRDANKPWRGENRARLTAIQRNREAKKKNSGTHTANDITDIIRMQKRKCAICGEKLGKSYHVDHIIPLDMGGSNDRRNLQVVHPSCNLQKRNRDPIEFMQSLGRLL